MSDYRAPEVNDEVEQTKLAQLERRATNGFLLHSEVQAQIILKSLTDAGVSHDAKMAIMRRIQVDYADAIRAQSRGVYFTH